MNHFSCAPRAFARRMGVLLLVVQAGCSTLSLPRALQTDGFSAGSFPDAGAVVLEDVATLEFRVMQVPNIKPRTKRLVAVLDHRRRMKILRETGLAMADIRLPVDGFTTVLRVVGRSVSPDGAETWMSPRSLRLVDRKEPDARAPEVVDLNFKIPGAQVGGLVEYRYERVFLDPALVPAYVFGAAVPVVHSELGIVTDPEVKLDYRFGRGDNIEQRAPLLRSTDDGRERLVFIETDLPAYFDELHMPTVAHSSPWLSVALRKTALSDQPERVESWDDVGDQVIGRMVQVNVGSGEGTVRNRLELVRNALTPLEVPGLGVRQSQTAEGLLSGAPACSRDASAISMRALKDSGVKAGVVLLTGPQSPPVPEDFPAQAVFSRAAVALTADANMLAHQNCPAASPFLNDQLCGVKPGSRIFFDPLCKWCPFGSLPPEFGGSRALYIDGSGTSSWITIPLDPPGRNSLFIKSELTLDVDGSMTGNLSAQARGTIAGHLRKTLETGHVDLNGALAIALARSLLGEGERPSTNSAQVDKFEKVDEPLVFKMGLKAQAASDRYIIFRVNPEALAGTSIPSFWRGARNTAAVVEGPWWKEYTVKINMPNGFTVKLPPPVKLSTPVADYASGFAVHGSSVTYARRFVLKKAIVPVSEWHDFHEFFEAVREAEKTDLQMMPSQ